jgi:hypothetical protein
MLFGHISGAMAVNPDHRPQSIAEFRDALGCGPLRNHPALRTVPRSVSHTAPPRATPATQASPRTTTALQPAVGITTPPTSPPTATRIEQPDSGELDRLLARYIGPMAKIIAARARKEALDTEGLLQRIAEAIDDPSDRAQFLAAARRLNSG